MKDQQIILNAFWKDRAITAREYLLRCYEFLYALCEVSPVFDNRGLVIGDIGEESLRVSNDYDIVAVPKDYTAFEQVVARAIDDSKNCLYTNPDPSTKAFTLDSKFARGFTVSFSDLDTQAREESGVSITVTAGAHGKTRTTNVVLIQIPPAHRELWMDPNLAERLLTIVVDSWKPTFALLTSPALRDALDKRWENDFSVGRLTYFSNRAVGNSVLGLAAVSDFAGGGALISIDAPAPWADHVNLFQPCYNKLSAANLLKWGKTEQRNKS